MRFSELVHAAIAREAADLLLSPGSPPVLRVDGVLEPADAAPLTGELVRSLLDSLLDEGQRARFAAARELDFAVTLEGRRFRGNAYLRLGEPAVALRLLPARAPTPEALGLPPVLLDLVMRPQGLVLFTGAAGQGKSTSQASLVAHLNGRVARHVVTIEDPIEYVHVPDKCVIDQREVGRDTASFADALRHVLRQAPDLILVGEMRDLETIQTALTVAETGHLVFSTLHTNDAVQSITRIVDAFPESARELVRAQLAMALLAVVNQRLVRSREGRVVLAAEVLVNTQAVSSQIREGQLEQLYSTMEIDRRSGMQTMNHALDELVERGIVAPDVAARYAIPRESRRVRASTPPAR